MTFVMVAALINERHWLLATRAGHGLRITPHGIDDLIGIL